MWGWYAVLVGSGSFMGLANAAVPASRCALGCSSIAVPAAPCDSLSGFCCDPTAAPCPYPADLDNSTATFGGCQPGSSLCPSGLPCVSSWSYSQSCDVMCSRTAPNLSCRCELSEIAWCKGDLACEGCQLCSGPNGTPCPRGGICVNQACQNISATRAVDLPTPTKPAATSFDFRAFEMSVMPAYLRRFKVAGTGVAGYGALPHPTAATPYGARAALKALHVAGQLNISEAGQWAAFFDSFQNSTGLWQNYSKTGAGVKPFDTLYLATWEITDAFALIGRSAKYNNTGFEAIAADPLLWGPTFLPIFNGTQTGCGTIHGCGHKVAAIGVVLAATGHLKAYAPFFEWLLQQAKVHLDPTTGEICPALCTESKSYPECSNSLYDCLGGGMTYHSMLTFLGVEWPDAVAVQGLALELQKPDGLWSYMSDSMNFDAIYQLSRPCRQQQCNSSQIRRIRGACIRYVAAAHTTNCGRMPILVSGNDNDGATMEDSDVSITNDK